MKRSQLKELLGFLIREAMDAIPPESTGTTDTGSTSTTTMSVTQQQQAKKLQQKADQDKLKLQKKEEDQLKKKVKSLDADYKMTRRIALPSKHKEVQATQQRISQA